MKNVRPAFDSAVTLTADMVVSGLTLRAQAGGEALTDASRKELLAKSLAGEHVELTVDIKPFSQGDEPNRNFVRFKNGALSALGRSGKDSVFLRDHAQGQQLARGGSIIASKMSKLEDGTRELEQTVQVVVPWAVQGFLNGTIDRFSIGWHSTGPVLCTACKASIRECWHWPGDTVEVDGAEMRVEFEFQSAVLVETSAVVVPAVLGTGVDEIRAALGLDRKPDGDRHMSKPAHDEAAKLAAKEAVDAAIIAERTRGSEIRRTGETLGLDAKFIAEHVDSNTGASEFRKLAEDKFAAAKPSPVLDSGRPSIVSGDSQADKTRQEAKDWLLHKSGVHTRIMGTDGYKNDGGGQFRGMTLMEMARQCLRNVGVDVTKLSQNDVIKMTLSAGYQHTSDFPIAMEGVIHQEVLAQFALVANTYKQLSETGSQNDFRETSVYRRGSFGRLDKHQEGAEIKNKDIPDVVREKIGMSTVANIVALTRESMINDNLGLILGQAGDLGFAAGLSVELDFYDLIGENGGLGPVMQDGKTLLHADHKNIAPSSVLSITSVDADASLFAEQTDITGNTLNIEPTILWLPRNQRGLARKINRSMTDFTTGETVDAPNPVQGQFDSIIATTRLPKSPPRRYTLAPVAAVPVFRIQYLNGQQAPMLDREEGFRVLGTSWSVVFDYEWGVVAHEGIQTNQGT